MHERFHSALFGSSLSKRDLIEKAFLRLSLLEGREQFVEAAIGMLSEINCAGPGTAPTSFVAVGRTKIIKELEQLAWSDRNSGKAIKQLHQPTIDILVAHGYCRGADATPDKIKASAKQALRAVESDPSLIALKIPGGRPKDNRARAIGTLLAHWYERITGKMPGFKIDAYSANSKPQGPFINLVEDVFDALGLEVSAEHIAKVACKNYKANKLKANFIKM